MSPYHVWSEVIIIMDGIIILVQLTCMYMYMYVFSSLYNENKRQGDRPGSRKDHGNEGALGQRAYVH